MKRSQSPPVAGCPCGRAAGAPPCIGGGGAGGDEVLGSLRRAGGAHRAPRQGIDSPRSGSRSGELAALRHRSGAALRLSRRRQGRGRWGIGAVGAAPGRRRPALLLLDRSPPQQLELRRAVCRELGVVSRRRPGPAGARARGGGGALELEPPAPGARGLVGSPAPRAPLRRDLRHRRSPSPLRSSKGLDGGRKDRCPARAHRQDAGGGRGPGGTAPAPPRQPRPAALDPPHPAEDRR